MKTTFAIATLLFVNGTAAALAFGGPAALPPFAVVVERLAGALGICGLLAILAADYIRPAACVPRRPRRVATVAQAREVEARAATLGLHSVHP